jgi:hypothetical protein
MFAIYDQIQELRAELTHCDLTAAERADALATLTRLVAEQAKLDAACDADLIERAPPD